MSRWISTGALLLGASLLMAPGSCSQARKKSLEAMNAGVALAQQRNPESIAKFEEAARLDPTNDRAFYNEAMAHFDLEAYGAAANAMRQAIAVDGNNAMYQDKLATILLRLDPPNREQAKSALEAAVRIDPSLFKAHFRLAQVLHATGDDQGALASYTESIRRGPRFIEAYLELGNLYAQLDFDQQALQVLRAGVPIAIEGSQEKARLHHAMGAIHAEANNLDQAVAEFRTAVEIDPMPEALFSLGWTLQRMENREEAIRYLNKFLEVAGPNTPDQFKSAARDALARMGG